MNNEILNESANWRKSSHSGYNNSCIEVANLPEALGVRDSKDVGGAILRFTGIEWQDFVGRIQTVELDNL